MAATVGSASSLICLSVPIYDLKVKGTDLVIATHGRSFWILDDLTVLHQYGDSIADKTVHLMAPRRVERHLPKVFDGLFESGDGKQYMSTLGSVAPYLIEETPEHGRKETWLDSGVNPPKGAVITYYLREKTGFDHQLAHRRRREQRGQDFQELARR